MIQYEKKLIPLVITKQAYLSINVSFITSTSMIHYGTQLLGNQHTWHTSVWAQSTPDPTFRPLIYISKCQMYATISSAVTHLSRRQTPEG